MPLLDQEAYGKTFGKKMRRVDAGHNIRRHPKFLRRALFAPENMLWVDDLKR